MALANTSLPDQAFLSITCAVGASLAFSIGDIIVKSFSASLPLAEVIMFRSLFGLAFIVTILGAREDTP